MGQLCGERRHVRERWTASEWKGAAVFAEGLSGAVASGLGTIFKLVGQGGLSKKAQKVQADSGCKGIQGNTYKAEMKCVCLNDRSILNK